MYMCRFKKIINEILHSFYHIKSSKSGGYFILIAHLNLEAKFFCQNIYLCLDFIKYILEKVEFHVQTLSNIL
jgi:hypothetical protein